jgi:hypothetical protein
MKNLTNSINNEALKALEQSVEQQLAGYAVFPLAFYREDGSYISMFEAYKQSMINAISLGLIKPTGEIVTQMNMTPDDVRAAGLYYPLPCEPTGEIIDIIKQHQGELEEDQYHLAIQFLKDYGLCRYKGSFYIFKDNHYEYISDDTLKIFIRQTFIVLAEKNGNSNYVEGIFNELKLDSSIVVNENGICKTAVAFRNCFFDLDICMPVDKSENYTTMYSLNANFISDVFYNDYARSLSTTVFDEFLTRVSGGDINLIYRIWEMIGYVITPDNFGRSFFVIQGVPASGKSTIERLLMKMFSPGSVFKVNGEELGSKFVFQGLECKAIIIVSDMPDKDISRAGVSAIKKITGRDGISSDVKYRERTQFETNAKMVCFTNYPISSESYDKAFYDRAVTIPCRFSIPKSEQDFTLDDKLAMEIDAIATKALYYYVLLRMNNYQFAGRYTINECVQSGAFTDNSFRASIYRFVSENFISDPEGVVSTLEAHRMFCDMFGREFDRKRFTIYFCSAAMEMFGAVRDKIRLDHNENPRSVVKGIRKKI